MATISFGTSNPYIDGQLTWTATSNGSAANSSNVLLAIYLKRNNSGYVSYGTLNSEVYCNGARQDENGLYVTISENNWTLVYAKTFTVSHNNDGTKTCSVSIFGSSDFNFSFSQQFNFTLPNIPRYTAVTAWNVSSVSSNALTFSWSTADNISQIVCQFNGTTKYTSSSLNTNNGSFTISGLSEHTTYSNIKLTVTRKDSGLTTTSGALSATTNYISPTAYLGFSSSTINSLNLTWSSNFACDSIWIYNSGTQVYYANGLNAASGSVTLNPGNWPSISPGSAYSLTVKVKRTASQALTTSSAISVRTLTLPSINANTPTSFNIGSGITVQMSNYDSNESSLAFQAFSGDWVTINTVSVPKGTASKSITPAPASLYTKCINSNTLSTRIACSVTCNGKTYPSYYYMTANVTNSNPTFSGFSFETNTGTNINSIIGGTTNMLSKVGSLKLQFNANSATGINSATITKLEAKILLNNTVIVSENINYSTSAFSYLHISSLTTIGTYTLQVNAIDSRGNRSSVSQKSFTVYPYEKPALDVKMSRENEFEEKIFLNLTGEIAKATILSVQKNGISSLKYRYAESGGSFTNYTELTPYNTASGTNDNLIITIKKTDTANYFLKLDIEKSYTFQFLLADKMFDSAVYEVFLPQGKPAFAIFDNGYSVVDKIPNFSSPAKLQVGSDIMVRDSSGKDILLLEEMKKMNKNLTSRSELLKTMYLLMHPVGEILMTTSATNPGTIWGGTWVLWGSGRVPVGINTADGNFNTVEKTGGAATANFAHTHGISHTHTVNGHAHTTGNLALSIAQMPSHSHNLTMAMPGGLYREHAGYSNGVSIASVVGTIRNTGGGEPHNHGNTGNASPTTNTGTRTITDSSLNNFSTIQPYITCYMWKRTA